MLGTTIWHDRFYSNGNCQTILKEKIMTYNNGKTTSSKSGHNTMPSNNGKKSVQSDQTNTRQRASKTGRKTTKS